LGINLIPVGTVKTQTDYGIILDPEKFVSNVNKKKL